VYLESVENWKPNFRCSNTPLYISSKAVQAARSQYADYAEELFGHVNMVKIRTTTLKCERHI
jgi:hypothetical protein